MKSLVIYFSRTGNTRFMGKAIAESTNADIEEIIEVGKNRTGFLGYITAGFDGLLKKRSSIQIPEKSPLDYDIIYIGSPVWGWDLVPAVRGYLTDYSIKGKKLALFCTMGGSGDKRLFSSIKKLTSGCDIVGEFSMREVELKDKEKAKAKIKDWVNKIQG